MQNFNCDNDENNESGLFDFERHQRINELRNDCMSFCLDTYLRRYPKITQYLLEKCKYSVIDGIGDIKPSIGESDFEFSLLLMDEMRDYITDSDLLNRIEDAILRLFRVQSPMGLDYLLVEFRSHIYEHVHTEVNCIIDECNDYLGMGYNEMLEQRKYYL